LINGVAVAPEVAALSVFDPIVLRGDGCFEAARIYGGRCFRLHDHLARLARSAAALEIELPPLDEIARWCATVSQERGEGIIRVLASAGPAGAGTVVVLSQPLPQLPARYRLMPQTAVWHPAGDGWALAGVKALSYAPNMAATRRAKAEGFDDALLVSRDGTVLEGPTSSVAWVVSGVFETAELGLGILESITRRVVLELTNELGIRVVEGRFPIERVLQADEAMVLSTLKEVRPIAAVGKRDFVAGPVTALLSEAYARRVIDELTVR